MNINTVKRYNPHTLGVGYVNGKAIRVMFDTGLTTSVLTQTAAASIGIDVTAAGVKDGGSMRVSGGARRKLISCPSRVSKLATTKRSRIPTYEWRTLICAIPTCSSARIFSFSTGYSYRTASIGFTSHTTAARYSTWRIRRPRKWNRRVSTDAQEPEVATDVAARTSAAVLRNMRLGARSLGHEFARALADLSKAIELDPDGANYLYDRAQIYVQTGHASLALADLTNVLALKPQFIEAYISRAQLRLGEKNNAEALADLDAAVALAPPQGDVRFTLGQLYAGAQNFGAAIKQWDLWIDSHPVDARFASIS